MEWEEREDNFNKKMEEINTGSVDPHTDKGEFKFNGRFPADARSRIDLFVRDFKYFIKELLEPPETRLTESKKESAEKTASAEK